jgi:hypothetical protein
MLDPRFIQVTGALPGLNAPNLVETHTRQFDPAGVPQRVPLALAGKEVGLCTQVGGHRFEQVYRSPAVCQVGSTGGQDLGSPRV